jgi:RNA polymerase sigma-70 factor (ECF subfamily)
VIFGAALLDGRARGLAIGWADRLMSGSRVDSEAMAAARPLPRPPGEGAWVEDGAIRLSVERARDGESEALGELFQVFRQDVLRLCTRLLGPVDAEDASNETFQRAGRRLDRYDPAQPFRRWLLSIAAHHCIDRLRRRDLEKRVFEPDREGDAGVEGFASDKGSALDGILQAERQATLLGALDRLPDRYRAPLVLRYFAELSYDAIGEELGLSRSQVASTLFRGKQQLRAMLRGHQEGGS